MPGLDEITHEELQRTLTLLDQGIYHHRQWLNATARTLICRLPADLHDLHPHAYRECRFGQLLYGEISRKINAYPGFVAVEAAHTALHLQASKLLNEIDKTPCISTFDYDQFALSVEKFRLEVFSLKSELENLIFKRDSLTGAINRVTMPQILREEQGLSRRQNKPSCIAMLDIDLFKNVNDLYGHQTGDYVLSAITRHIIDHLRLYDKIFRYGGEEFLISFPFTELHGAHEISERLRKGVAELKMESLDKSPFQVTVSIGLALLSPYAPIERSIEQADKAMYEAKSAGRNCTKIFTPEPGANK